MHPTEDIPERYPVNFKCGPVAFAISVGFISVCSCIVVCVAIWGHVVTIEGYRVEARIGTRGEEIIQPRIEGRGERLDTRGDVRENRSDNSVPKVEARTESRVEKVDARTEAK